MIIPCELFSQVNSYLNLVINVVQNNAPVNEAEIKFLKNGFPSAEDVTKENGQYTTVLPANADYTVIISKANCKTSYVKVNTTLKARTLKPFYFIKLALELKDQSDSSYYKQSPESPYAFIKHNSDFNSFFIEYNKNLKKPQSKKKGENKIAKALPKMVVDTLAERQKAALEEAKRKAAAEAEAKAREDEEKKRKAEEARLSAKQLQEEQQRQEKERLRLQEEQKARDEAAERERLKKEAELTQQKKAAEEKARLEALRQLELENQRKQAEEQKQKELREQALKKAREEQELAQKLEEERQEKLRKKKEAEKKSIKEEEERKLKAEKAREDSIEKKAALEREQENARMLKVQEEERLKAQREEDERRKAQKAAEEQQRKQEQERQKAEAVNQDMKKQAKTELQLQEEARRKAALEADQKLEEAKRKAKEELEQKAVNEALLREKQKEAWLRDNQILKTQARGELIEEYKKFPQGQTIQKDGVTIFRIVIKQNDDYVLYRRSTFSYGQYYFRDNLSITKERFEKDTKIN